MDRRLFERAAAPQEPLVTVSAAPEVSVVIPCLNEADTIEIVIREARQALDRSGIAGEILVADNGSTDGSRELARGAGARVVPVTARGYGSALMGGIAASHGRYIIMGDADASYDFGAIPDFVAKLRAGNALVMGCRLPSGGGHVAPGAMPFLHRWWGNPMFSWMVRRWFHAPIHDVHCGLRGFTRELYDGLALQCTGMEFASEMVIKSSLAAVPVSEVPITLRPDQRRSGSAHLRTFRDGWRHLRFYLVYSPRWLFLLPGSLLLVLGALGYALALPATRIGGAELDVNALLFSSLFVVLGYQSVLFAILTKAFAVSQGLLPSTRPVERFFKVMNLERGLVVGAAVTLGGLGLLAFVLVEWWSAGFGPLNYRATLRLSIPGAMFTSLGMQTILSSFFASILGLRRR
ncbi:MAG TPA: glycosyltransferase family 2 protein [Gemmatimonadaceae bacterium]|nr:glycosyltransferase family 2 protein [Gemmatimonadaceae bacterium]